MNVTLHYSLKKIAEIIGTTISGTDEDREISYLLLDSRKLVSAEGTLFFLLSSNDKFIKKIINELYEKGVRNFVCNKSSELEVLPKPSFLFVDNSFLALQKFARFHRLQFNIPIIGITGSNGKTITKEWLYQLLHSDFNIARSPRSYNSQIGVPLSLFQLHKENTLGIFEAGISLPGEMKSLEEMIQPTIGVFTNIGDAHNEGFTNNAEKIKEKLLLFTGCKTLIYCSDYEDIDRLIDLHIPKTVTLFSWGKCEKSILQIKEIIKSERETVIHIKHEGKETSLIILYTDDASIENAIHCLCVLKCIGTELPIVNKRMRDLQPVEMRLEVKQGINNCTIINDSYSCDLHSLQIALDFLNQQKQHDQTTVILSDILQSRTNSKDLYSTVAKLLTSRNVHRFIGIGPKISQKQKLFDVIPQRILYTSVNDFKKDFYRQNFNNETILLKGARIFEFEQINSMLELKVHQTKLSINLTAVAHNLNQFKKILLSSTKIMAMVKAYSYGSGAYEISKLLQYHKVDYLAVAYADEGVTLRKNGITLPIMVLNPDENSFSIMVQYFLEPELFSLEILTAFFNFLRNQGLTAYPIHLKIDSGMHRLGFEEKDINESFINLLKEKEFHIQTIFSHLIASQDASKLELTNNQLRIFLQCCDKIAKKLPYNFIKHIANSGAISQLPELQLDMVRIGIGLYGVDNNVRMQKILKNVTSLQTTISQIKEVKKDETVGYGGNIKLERDSVVATIRVGYADGYHRILGNGVGKVLIKGKLVPVVGNICMDMTMIDITDLANVHVGDSVEIFGDNLPIQWVAEWSNTIPYEIMTNISQRVKRVYFEE